MMATREMQMAQVGAGSSALRRIPVVVAVAAALTVGAVIGRETAGTSKTGAAVQPASAISFVGTSSADAARRAEVHAAIGRLAQPTRSTATQLTDAERRALVYGLLAEAGKTP